MRVKTGSSARQSSASSYHFFDHQVITAHISPGEYGGNRPAQAPVGFGQVGMTNQPVVRMPYGYNGQPGYAITPGYGGTVNTPAQIKICGNPFGCR